MIYGVAGTLNMADLARRFTTLAPDARTLFDTGAAILGIAFLIKAGSWPLNFWLPGTYSAAVAPVGAAFAMMTKVGVYALLRVGTLMSEDEAAASMLGVMMFYFGLATLLAGTIGMLAAHHLARLVSYSVVVSTGILLAALGLGIEALTAPVLFYLIVSSLTTGTFFMLTRHDGPHAQRAVARDAVGGARAAVAVLCGVRRARARPVRHGRRRRRRDSARDRVLRADVRELRAARDGPAAAAGLHREVRAAVDGDRHGAGRRARRRRVDARGRGAC